jgi:hypothetical protein
MRLVKTLLLIAIAAIIFAPIVGCGVGSDMADTRRAFNRVAGYDARMLVDDIALFAQTDRPLRTSHWIID